MIKLGKDIVVGDTLTYLGRVYEVVDCPEHRILVCGDVRYPIGYNEITQLADPVIHTPGGERARAVKPFPASAIGVWAKLVESWQTYGRTLPTDSAFRKEFPIESGVNRYFPAAIVCLAAWSKFNNNKHNPGEPLHHSRGKSSDHEECIGRHNFDIADAQRRQDDLTELEEATAGFWRAGARLQILCERLGAPPAPAARFPEETSK
jgi:hypothetical protein